MVSFFGTLPEYAYVTWYIKRERGILCRKRKGQMDGVRKNNLEPFFSVVLRLFVRNLVSCLRGKDDLVAF